MQPPQEFHDPARKSAQIEAAAEAVLEGKQLLVDLDRRANATREAINALKNKRILASALNNTNNFLTSSSSPALYTKPRIDGYIAPNSSMNTGNSSSTPSSLTSSAPAITKNVFILCNGGTFVQFNRKNAIERLNQDQNDTTRSIEETRDKLKEAVAELAKLEGPDSALAKLEKGFDLKSYNKK